MTKDRDFVFVVIFAQFADQITESLPSDKAGLVVSRLPKQAGLL